MSFRMAVSTLHSSDSLPRHRETRYLQPSIRCVPAMEAVYGLLGVDRGVPEVWGSVYDVRELLDSSVKLMDGKSPLQMNLGPLNVIKKPLLSKIKGTVIEKLLRDHDVLRDGMI